MGEFEIRRDRREKERQRIAGREEDGLFSISREQILKIGDELELAFEKERKIRVALENIIQVARDGDWEGGEVPNPVAAAIAHGEMVLRAVRNLEADGYHFAEEDTEETTPS